MLLLFPRTLALLPLPLPLIIKSPRLPLHNLLSFAKIASKSSSIMAAASSSSSPSLEWACSQCTFLNPPTQKISCQMCNFPPPSSPPAYPSQTWSCNICTFLNSASLAFCEMCRTRKKGRTSPAAAYETVELDEDEIADPAVGRVFLPLQRFGGGRKRKGRAESPDVVEIVAGEDVKNAVQLDELAKSGPSVDKTTFKIMSYNVWFREDLEVHKRMKALGDLIQLHTPDLICFQEVTPNIYRLFENSDWWQEYRCSLTYQVAVQGTYFCMQMSKLPVNSFSNKPFSNTIMARELCLADINVGRKTNFVLATSHLESPSPAPPRWDQMFSKERVAQANESIKILEERQNVIFCGDMNWDDKLDGPFPLPDGWVDAWAELKPDDNGWTYDTRANGMLSGNRTLQKRLDRFVCKLPDFQIDSIEMIGQEAIPGLSYTKEKKFRNEIKTLELPVLPSDHFGLLLTISYKDCAT